MEPPNLVSHNPSPSEPGLEPHEQLWGTLEPAPKIPGAVPGGVWTRPPHTTTHAQTHIPQGYQ